MFYRKSVALFFFIFSIYLPIVFILQLVMIECIDYYSLHRKRKTNINRNGISTTAVLYDVWIEMIAYFQPTYLTNKSIISNVLYIQD